MSVVDMMYQPLLRLEKKNKIDEEKKIEEGMVVQSPIELTED